MPDPSHVADPVVHDEEEQRALDEAERRPEAGIALCLSGGGYRAMLFHAGSVWRLNDAGMLPQLDRISSKRFSVVAPTPSVFSIHVRKSPAPVRQPPRYQPTHMGPGI